MAASRVAIATDRVTPASRCHSNESSSSKSATTFHRPFLNSEAKTFSCNLMAKDANHNASLFSVVGNKLQDDSVVSHESMDNYAKDV